MKTKGFEDFWDQQRQDRDRIRLEGKVLIEYRNSNGFTPHLYVVCPKDERFIAQAKLIGGIWLQRSQVWSFRGFLETVEVLCASVFGSENVQVKERGRGGNENKSQ